MKLLKTILSAFISVVILFSVSALGMNEKINDETALMDQITQEFLKSENPNNKAPNKRVVLNKLITQLKDVNHARNSDGYPLLHIAWQNKSCYLLQAALSKKPHAEFVFKNIVGLFTVFPDEKSLSRVLINHLNDMNDPNYNIAQIANQFDEKSIEFEFISSLMSNKMKKLYKIMFQLKNIKNFPSSIKLSGPGNINSKIFKQHEQYKVNYEAKRKKIKTDLLESQLKNYKEGIEKRFAAEENIDIKAIGEIVGKAQEVTQEIQALQGAGDAGHAQQLAAWKKRLQQEKILQENTQKFARAQKKKLFQSMQTLSRNLKALRSDEAVIPANNGNKNSEVHAFTMQQIHRDPYWHAQYVGDVRAVEIRKAAEQEIQSHNDAQAWWTAHEKDNKHCMACYNHALAMAKPNVTQKQRRNSF